jgi:hypothetical protein
VIDIETRLLEILDWDESRLERVYEKAAKFLENQKTNDVGSLERLLVSHLRSSITEEGARLIFRVLDQNIRKEMRIIEE